MKHYFQYFGSGTDHIWLYATHLVQTGSGWNLTGLFFKGMNTHRLMESDFGYDVILSRWRPWRHFAKSLRLWRHWLVQCAAVPDPQYISTCIFSPSRFLSVHVQSMYRPMVLDRLL